MLEPLRQGLKLAVYRVFPRSRLFKRGPSSPRRIALSFDDGPDDMTMEYLALLDELDVRATFFLVGRACESHPTLVAEYQTELPSKELLRKKPHELYAQLSRTPKLRSAENVRGVAHENYSTVQSASGSMHEA